MTAARTVRLGFEVGSGAPIDIPLAHTFVTGQTQLSGKTTTLRAIVERSGQRALAFVTKRGEDFAGRRVRPYLPREGEQPIHWRLVETILASALGQRSMKYERLWLINAVKRPTVATSLVAVRSNVAALVAKAKGNSVDVYTLIGEYLDLVLPDMRALHAADVLALEPGLNVMDLAGVSQQLQALVIRASLEHINKHESGVLTVFPEAWEFAPRQTNSPAKDAAIAMARKGAVLGNFLLCDSQDIAGVDTTVRQAASVWILGVQRELNELKRTIQTIPAGIQRPKSEDVAQLEVGEFFACWGRHAVKTYVQPAGMADAEARGRARGDRPRTTWRPPINRRRDGEEDTGSAGHDRGAARAPGDAGGTAAVSDHHHQPAAGRPWSVEEFVARGQRAQRAVDQIIATHQESHEMNPAQEQKLDRLVETVSKLVEVWSPAKTPAPARPSKVDTGRPPTAAEDPPDGRFTSIDAIYREVKARLLADAETDPQLLRVLTTRPELRVEVQRRTVETSGDTLRGRLALFIAEGWFDTVKAGNAAHLELQRRGVGSAKPNVYRELDRLAADGFVTKEDGGYQAVAGMKRNIVEV